MSALRPPRPDPPLPPVPEALATARLEAERGLLGALTLAPKRFREVASSLAADDFALAPHGLIWDAMAALAGRGLLPDWLAVKAELQARGTLERVGGAAYLGQLLDYQARGVHLDTYVRLILDAAVRRRLRAMATDLERASVADRVETVDTLDETRRALDRLAASLGATEQDGLMPAADAVPLLADRVASLLEGQSLAGLGSGFQTLDYVTGGFRGGQMIVLAGRTGMGKTSLALQIAMSIASREIGAVAIYTLEMSRDENLLRAVCQDANVDSKKFLHGCLPPQDHAAVRNAMARMAARDYAVCERGTVREGDIRRQCEALAVTSGLALIVVDYLQLMTPTGKFSNRTEAVSSLSRAMKCLARDLDVPVLALSQLSRAQKGQERRRPELSDLRESGAIEQDADKVLFVHREETVTAENTAGSVIVAKNRQGPCGVVPMTWIAHATRWEEA